MNPIQILLIDHLDLWTAADSEKKSGRGRAAGNAASVYGIKKLRELILELAMRGKLVPQDPNDELASELLKRIQAEKAKLVAEGKIKKEKPLATIAENEKPFELPHGWSTERLGNLAHLITKGTTPTSLGFSYQSEGIRFVKVENVSFGRINLDSIDQYISAEADSALARSRLIASDVLFSIAGTIGRTCILHPTDIPANTNQAFAIIRGTKIVFDQMFLLRQLDSFVSNKTKAKARGGAMYNVSLSDLAELVLIIPPLAEQHRIVAKVDELMALCDQLETQHSNAAEAHEKLVSHLLGTLTHSTVRGELVEPHPSTGSGRTEFEENWQRIAAHFDTLFTTEASIDALKQTLLQLAVMGKLVAQDPNDEPVSELLKRIQVEKMKLNKGIKSNKNKELDKMSANEKPFELPNSWEWVRLGQIGDWGAGATPLRSVSSYYGGETPWFKSGELTADFIDTSEETITELALKDCSLRLNQPGDVLIAMYGATIGKTAILKVPGTTNQAVCACTPNTGIFNRYLLVLLKATKSNFIGQGAGGAQPNISREKIISTIVAMPPTAEQHRIVAKVDELMALCDQLENRIIEARQLQQKLADVLVAQALAVSSVAVD